MGITISSLIITFIANVSHRGSIIYSWLTSHILRDVWCTRPAELHTVCNVSIGMLHEFEVLVTIIKSMILTVISYAMKDMNGW